MTLSAFESHLPMFLASTSAMGHTSRLVPASGGGPGCIFGHFSLSVVRRSTRRSMGKVANRRPTDLCPQESPEKAEIRAGHANVSNVETVEIGYVVGRARKFQAQDEFCTDKVSREKRRRRTKFLLSLAADSGADTNKKHNNQPNKRFDAYLGRTSMRFWVDWAAVALVVSLLVSGPFSRTRTQVDCFELYFLIQISSDEAETFA